MVECNNLKKCPFFNDKMVKMPATSVLFKAKYCNSGFKECARFVMANIVGSSEVPQDLFPNQHERVNKLIFELKHLK
ncbi:MAG: hypothetical protein ACFFAT_03805 [Promethearchaeota archaeon]